MVGSNTVRSPHYGALQDVVDSLYLGLGPKEKLRRLDIVVAGEAAGSKYDKAVALSVPVLDEAALLRILETGEAPE